MLSFVRKYLPWLLEEQRFLQFRTPLICIIDNKDNIVEYFFNLADFAEYEKKYRPQSKNIKYFKGLGSWDAKTLEKLIEKIGADKFFIPFELDENYNETILNWFLDDRVDFRKDKLLNNQFNIEAI